MGGLNDPNPLLGTPLPRAVVWPDTIANRTRDLSVYSGVPQSTTPPRVSLVHSNNCDISHVTPLSF